MFKLPSPRIPTLHPLPPVHHCSWPSPAHPLRIHDRGSPLTHSLRLSCLSCQCSVRVSLPASRPGTSPPSLSLSTSTSSRLQRRQTLVRATIAVSATNLPLRMIRSSLLLTRHTDSELQSVVLLSTVAPYHLAPTYNNANDRSSTAALNHQRQHRHTRHSNPSSYFHCGSAYLRILDLVRV